MDAAARGFAAAAHCHHTRRHHLLRGLFARLSGPARSQDGRDQGVAFAERAEVAALWDHLSEWSDLVLRIGGETEYIGALRFEDREISDLGDSRGRRRCAQ